MTEQPRKGRFVPKKSELPQGLSDFLTEEDVEDLVAHPEAPENWKDHVLPVDPPITEAQKAQAAHVELLYASAEARAELLAEATKVVTVDRNVQYGSPEDSFSLIADLWGSYLSIDLLPQDVANLMIMLKIARLRTNPVHRDSWVDIAGYAACGGTMTVEETAE